MKSTKELSLWGFLSKGISRIGDILLYLPSFLTYSFLILIPFGILIVSSFTNYNWTYPDTDFIWFQNYSTLFSDIEFRKSLLTTLKFALIIIVAPNISGLLIALLLNKKGKLYNAVRVLIFMPMTLSAVVVSVVWGSILTDNGILNAVLKQLNLSGLAQSWIGSQTLALP